MLSDNALSEIRADHDRRHPKSPGALGTPYTTEEVEFGRVVDRYKRLCRRPYPTWSEVLDLLKALGWRRFAAADMVPAETDAGIKAKDLPVRVPNRHKVLSPYDADSED